MKPKLIITGHARHGKDTVCEILRDKHNYTFESSSHILAEEVVFPALADKYGYSTVEECYADRINHRKEWFELLKAYNSPDATHLGRKIFEKYDIYCGLRNIHELHAMQLKKLFDVVIWVDAGSRVPEIESTDSMTIPRDYADIILWNSGTKSDLVDAVADLTTILENFSIHFIRRNKQLELGGGK